MRFITVDKKGRATLPEDVRSALGLEGGDLLLLEKTERGTYELIPATLVPKDQLWFHPPQMRDRIAKAEDEFREERVSRTASPDEAKAFLDGLKGDASRNPRRR